MLVRSNLASGAHSLKAVYAGDAVFGGSSSPAVGLTVKAAPTVLRADPVIQLVPKKLLLLQATLTRAHDGMRLPGKTVVFKAGGRVLCTSTTNSSGVASCTVSVLELVKTVLNLGYKASFSGTPAYLASSATGKLL